MTRCKACGNVWKRRVADTVVVNTEHEYSMLIRCPKCGQVEKVRK